MDTFKIEKSYAIRDSKGRFVGGMGLSPENAEKSLISGRWNLSNWKWNYWTHAYPTSWHGFRENIEIELAELIELNTIAQYEDLEWEIVEFTEEERLQLCKIQRLEAQEQFMDKEPWIAALLFDHKNFSIQNKDIPEDHVGKHRKAEREIKKKYKLMPRTRIA